MAAFALHRLRRRRAIRTPVPDARLLMLAAIQATDGRPMASLTGEMADAITRRFGATSPIYIDVTTEKRYAQPGCSRLKVTFWQDGVLLPGAPAPPADDGLRHQLLPRRPAAASP